MRKKKPNKFDLNLFHVFNVIYTTRSITQASYNLGLTQPAVSNALARMRKSFDDQIFVRSSNGMVPTSLAIQIFPVVKQALETLDSVIDNSFDFDPKKCKKTFYLAMTDYGSVSILQKLTEKIYKLAPEVKLRVFRLEDKTITQKLANGDIDIALSSSLNVVADIYASKLFTDEFICMARVNHISIKGEMTLDDFVKYPHVLYAPQEGKWGIVSDLLESKGLEHRTVVYSSHAYSIPEIIAQTDLITVIPKRLAHKFSVLGEFQLLEPPIEIPCITLKQYWHLGTKNDPANMWLRKMIVDASS